jgi:hypothetical protein
VFPFLIADDLIGEVNSKPTRYVIDFHPRDLPESKVYKKVFEQVRSKVLPDRKKAAKEEEERNEPVLKADPKRARESSSCKFSEALVADVISTPRHDRGNFEA